MGRRLWAILLAGCLCLVLARPAAAAGFDDVGPDHWAHAYVRALDEEGVVDAYRIRVFDRWWWVDGRGFLPNHWLRRDAWYVFLARLLDAPRPGGHLGLFRDVSAQHRLESGEPVSAWLEAAGLAGMVSGPWLLPLGTLPRQEAVADLVRILALEPFARGLPEEEVSRALARFRDAYRIAPHRRRALAAAARVRILQGYPDGTLRPEATLTRAEAAAVLARSALVRVRVEPNPFSPDGDGIDEVAGVSLQVPRNRATVAWWVAVYHAGGAPAWSSARQSGPPPRTGAAVRWHGRDAGDVLLPADTYYVQASIVDAYGQRWDSALMPLELVLHRLDAWLEPAVVAPGETVTLVAFTRGPAPRVTAEGPGVGAADPVFLTPTGQSGHAQGWRLTLRVPEDAPEGPRALVVRARFPRATRQRELAYTVQSPVTLTGWVDPDPVAAGARLGVFARTSPDVRWVRARFADGHEVSLVPVPGAPGSWHSARTVPPDATPGPSWVELHATSPRGSRSLRVPFRIERSPLHRIRAVLTD